MEFDRTTTLGVFFGLVILGMGGLFAFDVMAQQILFMMVLPSVLIFGGLCLFLGMRFGEYRAVR
jgi:hypothetical protein